MSVAAEIIELLTLRGWTMGVAESLTGGALSSALVAVPGASAVFVGAVVAYATPVKHTLLDVDTQLLAEYGPVHPEVAVQMAAGVRVALQVDGHAADVGISTTGIAGPDSPDGQAVGTVHIGIAMPEGNSSRSFVFSGDRSEIRAQAVDAALLAVRSALKE